MTLFVAGKLFNKAGEGSGGGGSDPHNLGYYADLTALQTAHPTGTDGDYAILGSTDTIWVWDSGTSAWVDSDQKGQVTSVNNQTGAVTVQETLVSGMNIKTINNTSLLGAGDLTIDSLPSQSGNTGKFLTTDGSSASWANVDALPTQTGQNGKFLTTNGSTASWADVDSLPSQTGNAGKFLQTDGTDASWQNAAQVSQPSTMPTLAVADWVLDSGTNKYTQTVNVTSVTATNVVYVAPFPANADEYAQCNVIAVSQGAGTIGFQADVLPTNALGVNIIVLS